MAPPSSSWSSKLEKRLNGLADKASKESIQTLVNWMCFNRKHGPAFCSSLLQLLSTNNLSEARQWLYWQVIHALLLQESPSINEINSNGPSSGSATGSSNTKWERLEALRCQVGQDVILPILQQESQPSRKEIWDKVSPLFQEWDQINVFGGDVGSSLLNQMKRLLAQKIQQQKRQQTQPSTATTTAAVPPPQQQQQKETKKPTETSDVAPQKSKPESTVSPQDQSSLENKSEKLVATDAGNDEPPVAADMEETKKQPKILQVPEFPNLQRSASSTLKQQEEKKQLAINLEILQQQIPAAKVEIREFSEPCKQVATLQIARDLRSEFTAHLPTLLGTIPANIRQECLDYYKQQQELEKKQKDQDKKEKGDNNEDKEKENEEKNDKDNDDDKPKLDIDPAKLQEYSIQLPSAILDMDVDEALEHVRTFRDIVKKLRACRLYLMTLFVKSRCQFGAQEAAQAFYGLDPLEQHLVQQQSVLSDAMDLEGMLELDNDKKQKEEEEEEKKRKQALEPFPWYTREQYQADKQQKQEQDDVPSPKRQKVA